MIQIHHQQLERMIWGCWKFDFWSTSSPDHLLPHCPPSARLLTVFNLNADFRIPLIYGFTTSDSINKNHLVILDIQSRNIDLEKCNHLWTKNIILTFSALLGVTDISTLTLLRNHQEIGSSPEKCRQLSVGRIQYTLCELYPVSFCLSVFSKV